MSRFLPAVVAFGNAWTPYLIYLSALAAAGLLPFKKSFAYRGVALLLALVWVEVALLAPGWRNSVPCFWMAVVEALILVVLATAGRLEFPARNGRWSVVGTAFVVYSLLIFPFLGRINERALGSPPLPLLLFTCGVLFFAVERTANVALVVPLFLALVAGPPPAENVPRSVEEWGLRIALLAGSFYALLPPELRGGSYRRLTPGFAYRFASARRASFGRVLWALVMVTLSFYFLLAASGGGLLGDPRMRQIGANLVLLSGLGIAIWLAFPAWQSLWFRYAAWGAARVCGRAWGWLQDAWRWGVLLLAVVALVSLSFKSGSDQASPSAKPHGSQPAQEVSSHAAAGEKRPQKPLPTAATDPVDAIGKKAQDAMDAGWSVMSLWRELGRQVTGKHLAAWPFFAAVLLWLAYQAYRGRKRLVIETFADYTGEEKRDKWVAGLGARLESELARISDLYKVIDEARPLQRGSVVEVTAGVQEVGEILKDASAIKFGPLQVPANFLIGLVGRIVSGPHLTGALYKVEKRYVLTAELNGGGLAGNWRVDFDRLSEEERRLPAEAAVLKLVEQLAFRVATNLVSIGSPRWRAVRFFTEGLRFYRETQQQRRGRDLNLREAERCFIRALNEDQRFAQCHYDLGVVYRQLGQFKAAESAFRRALTEHPADFESHYALAETLEQQEKHARAVWFCEAATGLNPADPRAWDLKAFAQRKLQQEIEHRPVALPKDHPAWSDILDMREIAVALAWKALCSRALRGSFSAMQSGRDTVCTCARNLAVVLTRLGRYEESSRLFQQAAWIAPHDANLRLHEGRTFFWARGWKGASESLRGVFADALEPSDQGLLWSIQAQVNAQSLAEPARKAAIGVAHDRFLDVIAVATADELRDILERSLESPPPGDGEEDAAGALYLKRLRSLCLFLLELEPECGDERDNDSELEQLLRGFERMRSLDNERGRLERLHTLLDDLAIQKDEREDRYLERLLERTAWGKEDGALGCLQPLLGHLELEQGSSGEHLGKWIADSEWAHAQVQVRWAQLCLEEEPMSPRCCELAIKAELCLKDAIRKLEKRDSFQPRRQGLYGLLASTYLMRARAPITRAEESLDLIQKALACAQHAIELEPESIPERLVHIQILAALGDYGKMKSAADVALDLNSDSKTLRTIGASFWGRVASLRGRGARRKLLREAILFFESALSDVESAPFNAHEPREQVQAHGWVHYWLGRFQCERGHFDEATAHLETASRLGFKPLESKVELAWAYLLARDASRAEKAFQEVDDDAGRLGSPDSSVAQGPGEERLLGELKFDMYLGWSFLAAERDPDRSSQKIRQAEQLFATIARPNRAAIRAALQEARGRVHLAKGEVEKAVKVLGEAVKLSARSGAYVYLVFALLEQARANSARAPAALRRAREAYRLAREADVRGRYRREVWRLRGELHRLEKIDAKPIGPPSQGAPH